MGKLAIFLRRIRHIALLLIILFFGYSVYFGRTPEEKIKQSVAEARTILLRINSDVSVSKEFHDSIQNGGSLAAFIKSHLEDSTLGPYVPDKPTMREIVVVKQNPDGTVVIEGYLDDLLKPFLTESIQLNPYQQDAK